MWLIDSPTDKARSPNTLKRKGSCLKVHKTEQKKNKKIILIYVSFKTFF